MATATATDPPPVAVRYDGTDPAGLLALVAAGHGLAVLPADLPPYPGVVAVPLRAPKLVHRIEMLHGNLPTDSPADLLARSLKGSRH